MDMETSDHPGYDDFNSFDADQLSRQEKINRAKRNKTREQASAKTITPNKFISDRTRHVGGFGMFDNQGFEAETTNNDSYEKFSRHKSKNNNDIENYVPQRVIRVAGVTRDETRVVYSSTENSENEEKAKSKKTEKGNYHQSKENDIEDKIEDLKISQTNDPKTQ